MLYCDLSSNGVTLWCGKPCLHMVDLNHYGYVGFIGALMFCDTQGTSDPSSPGLGSRFLLYWIPEANPVVYPSGNSVTIPLQDVQSQQLDIVLGPTLYTISIYESDPS